MVSGLWSCTRSLFGGDAARLPSGTTTQLPRRNRVSTCESCSLSSAATRKIRLEELFLSVITNYYQLLEQGERIWSAAKMPSGWKKLSVSRTRSTCVSVVASDFSKVVPINRDGNRDGNRGKPSSRTRLRPHLKKKKEDGPRELNKADCLAQDSWIKCLNALKMLITPDVPSFGPPDDDGESYIKLWLEKKVFRILALQQSSRRWQITCFTG